MDAMDMLTNISNGAKMDLSEMLKTIDGALLSMTHTMLLTNFVTIGMDQSLLINNSKLGTNILSLIQEEDTNSDSKS